MTWELVLQIAVLGFLALMFFMILIAGIMSLISPKSHNQRKVKTSRREDKDGWQGLG